VVTSVVIVVVACRKSGQCSSLWRSNTNLGIGGGRFCRGGSHRSRRMNGRSRCDGRFHHAARALRPCVASDGLRIGFAAKLQGGGLAQPGIEIDTGAQSTFGNSRRGLTTGSRISRAWQGDLNGYETTQSQRKRAWGGFGLIAAYPSGVATVVVLQGFQWLWSMFGSPSVSLRRVSLRIAS
jgi:hypothetical protein